MPGLLCQRKGKDYLRESQPFSASTAEPSESAFSGRWLNWKVETTHYSRAAPRVMAATMILQSGAWRSSLRPPRWPAHPAAGPGPGVPDGTLRFRIGLRDKLGAIPLIIDDVNRDRFTDHVPDLVSSTMRSASITRRSSSAPNRCDGGRPDLSKRIVVCAIHGARPRSLSQVPARRALCGIGTALYRAYLNRLTPLIPDLVAKIADDPLTPPDLIRSSSEIVAELITEALGERPSWARQVSLDDLDRLKDKPFLDWLREIDEQNRATENQAAEELMVNFAGDLQQAIRFEKQIPPQALKNRLADTVKLDLAAWKKEYGFAARGARRPWLARLLGR